MFQPADGYRAAIDPVFLAAAVPVKSGEKVLDVGSGTGAASLALAVRVDGIQVTGLEQQAELAALALKSAKESGLDGQVSFLAGDLLNSPEELARGGFDHVMANPPYLAAGRGNLPPDEAKRKATVEGDAVLGDWLGFMLAMVADGGTITVVHRFDRTDEVVKGLSKGAGDIVILPLWQKQETGEAKRVIVQARKGREENTVTASGFVLHSADGGYTTGAEAVLRDAVALDLSL